MAMAMAMATSSTLSSPPSCSLLPRQARISRTALFSPSPFLPRFPFPAQNRPSLPLHSTPPLVVASLDFADQEAAKFRQSLLEELHKEENSGDVNAKIADICTKVFRNFVETYSGSITPQPFESMKSALEQEGLPSGKAIRTALWWARMHLYNDWQQWTTVKR